MAGLEHSIDPITRYVQVSYPVPGSAPERVSVRAEVRAEGATGWSPASVWPHVSDTAIQLMPPADWNAGLREGRLTERRAAGIAAHAGVESGEARRTQVDRRVSGDDLR